MNWQPIETAPVEVEVIVFDPDNSPSVFTAVQRDGLGPHFGGWHCNCEGRSVPEDDFYGDAPKRPTHWMPLPEPPR